MATVQIVAPTGGETPARRLDEAKRSRARPAEPGHNYASHGRRPLVETDCPLCRGYATRQHEHEDGHGHGWVRSILTEAADDGGRNARI